MKATTLVILLLASITHKTYAQSKVSFGTRMEIMLKENNEIIQSKLKNEVELKLDCIKSTEDIYKINTGVIDQIERLAMKYELMNYNELWSVTDDSLFNYHIYLLDLFIEDYNAVTCSEYAALLHSPPSAHAKAAGQPCENFDFETGDFSGWEQITGTNDGSQQFAFVNGVVSNTFCTTSGPCTEQFGAPDPGSYIPNFSCGNFFEQYFIHTNGTDTTCMGELFDDTGTNVAILGDGFGGADAKRIRQTFAVQPGDIYLEIKFSAILEDPGHPVEEQPYFQIRVFDSNGNTLPCSEYQVIANNALPGWIGLSEIFGNINVWGLPWTKKLVPVTAYQGQDVTVEVTVADCGQAAHYGQALVDATCIPGINEVLNQTGPIFCFPAQIQAPSGYNYSWSNGATTQSITAGTAGTYSVDIVSPGDLPACGVTLSTVIEPCALSIELGNWEVNCASAPKLQWTTNSEINVDYFSIERSCDGVSFQEIAQIEPSGGLSVSQDYSFIDNTTNKCSESTWYYRLSETDIDGNIEVFSTKSVNCEDNIATPEITMNQKDLIVSYDQSFTLQLITAEGKIIRSNMRSGENHKLALDCSQLSSGMYLVLIESNEQFVQRIFINPN